MSEKPRPTFRELDKAECAALLERQRVGRIAFSFHDRVDLEPIGFVASDGWIFGRTAPGAKLSTLEHHPWVAFEADEHSGPYDWQSVVVHGRFHVLEDSGSPTERERYQRAIAALRDAEPEALTEADPVPSRQVVFGIAMHETSGRAARS